MSWKIHLIFLCICGELVRGEYLNVNTTQSLCSDNFCDCFEVTNIVTFLPMVVIDCSTKNVTTLELDDRRLPIMSASVDFSRNQIRYLRGNSLFASVTLRRVDLSRNKIVTIVDMFFRNVPNAVEIDLSHNELVTLSSGVFFGLTKLQSLDLSFNYLTALPNKFFLDLTRLESLSLSYNPIGGFLRNDTKLFDLDNLSLTNKIQVLHLNNISLADFPIELLEPAHNLREIYLADNPLTAVPELPITMEVLDMSGTGIRHLSPKNLRLPSLRRLIINRAYNLTKIENYAFYHLNRVEVISLENCIMLSDFNDMAFGVHKIAEDFSDHTLHTLSLARSAFSYLNESLVFLLLKTANIDLTGNPWHCDCHLEWIKRLNAVNFESSYLRCFSPPELQFTLIKDLSKQTCYMDEVFPWISLTFIGILLLIIVSITLHVTTKISAYEQPLKQVMGAIGPHSPYDRIIIEPNRAE